MKVNEIETLGIISQDDLKSYNIDYPRREMCKMLEINLPKNIPEINTLLQVFFDVKVIENKIIYTQGKNKFFIHGIITAKIIYNDKKSSKNINTVDFNEHFSCLLPTNNDTENNKITTKAFIEDAIIIQEDNRNLYISLLLLICPVHIVNANENKKIEFVPQTTKVNKIENIEKKATNTYGNKQDIDIEIEYDMKKQ